MSTTDQTAQLHEELRTWAEGHAPYVAAVELLIEHDVWLRRPDFRRYLDQGHDHTGRPMTFIDWHDLAAGRRSLPASGSETSILNIALSLATGHPVALASEVSGLDATNTAAVARALIRAAQHTRTLVLATRHTGRIGRITAPRDDADDT